MSLARPNSRGRIDFLSLKFRPEDTAEEFARRLLRAVDTDKCEVAAVLRPHGVVVDCAGSAFVHRGATAGDVAGRLLSDGLSWELSDQSREDLRRAIADAAGGQFVRFDIDVHASSRRGERMLLDVTLLPLTDEEGQVAFLLLEGRDTTPQAHVRAEAAEAIRLRNAQFEAVLNRAPLGVFVIDADLRIRDVNPVALPIFGDIEGGVAGRDFNEVTHLVWPKEHADQAVEVFRHTLETGETFVAPETTPFPNAAGSVDYYNWRLDRIPLADGRFGVVSYFRNITEQINAREEIARSEERFRALVTARADAIYQMSADWSEVRRLEGRDFIADTYEENRGWVDKYIHPADQQMVLEAVHNAISTKSMFQFEHRVMRADGSVGWTFWRAVPLLDAHGEIVEWFGAAADITQRKNAEEALALLTTLSERQRRLYETVLSNTPDLVYVFDLNHRFTYANAALLTMWGKTAEEAIGKNCLELGYEPWHAAMHDREIEEVIATRQPIRGVVPFLGTHGRRIYDYIFVPVIGVNGAVEAIAGTTRDVTEMKTAEQRIRSSEERLRFMAESMPQKIFTARPDGEVDYFNQQWMEFTGLEAETLRGWTWAQLVHPADAAETMQLWNRSIESGEPFQLTHRIRRSDGAHRWHLSRAHAMRGDDGDITMWIGSSTDIHEQKDTEDNLRRANQDLEQFAYAATHDLQEPLRGIRIYSDLLSRRYSPQLSGHALECLNYLQAGATRMEMLVRDLLSYTQISKVENPSELSDASECLRIALENLSGAIQESGATVTSDPLPTVKMHHTHLQQLFQNLIGNAIKYRQADAAPRVHVSGQCENRQCHVVVSDNGIGIDPQYRDRIFGLFKRLHTNDKYTGTGVGLALCQRIVERSNGRIWVESKPGEGSQFHVILPM